MTEVYCYGANMLKYKPKHKKMMTAMIRIISIFCLVFTLSLAPAYAVEINDKGAASLKSMLSAHMENYKKSIKNSGGELKTEGEITIEQGDSYYAATLPATTYKTALNENIKIGLIAVNAIPTNNPDNWKISMALPTPILITNQKDEVIKRIDFGEQNMGGLWSGALDNFSKLSAQYNNFKFTDLSKNNIINIGKIIVQSDLEEKDKDSWSGPTTIQISNFSSNTDNAANKITLDDIGIFIKVAGFSPKAKEQALKKLSDTSENNGEFGNILNTLLNASGDVSTQLTFKNLKINNTTVNQTVTGVDLIQFGFQSGKPKDNKISQNFDVQYQGLGLSPTNKNLLIPKEFKTSISLDNLPLVDVINFASKTITEDKNSNARQVATQKARMFLPPKLKEAGTTLLIKNTTLGNSLYNVMLDGNIKPTTTSEIGAMGALNIEMTGIDNILKELQKTENGQSMAQQLTLFRLLSEEKGDKNILKLSLDAQGNILANGKDMSAIMGGAAGSKTPTENTQPATTKTK